MKSLNSLRSRAGKAKLGGHSFWVASLADVIASKETAGRPRDNAILDILRKTLREKKKSAAETWSRPGRPAAGKRASGTGPDSAAAKASHLKTDEFPSRSRAWRRLASVADELPAQNSAAGACDGRCTAASDRPEDPGGRSRTLIDLRSRTRRAPTYAFARHVRGPLRPCLMWRYVLFDVPSLTGGGLGRSFRAPHTRRCTSNPCSARHSPQF